MATSGYIQMAQDFLEKSDDCFAKGDVLKGSENAWDAAAHIVMAAAQQRGWPSGTHRHLSSVVRRLAEERNDPYLVSEFGVVEKFRANSHYGFMEDFEYEYDTPLVRDFVRKIRAIVERELTHCSSKRTTIGTPHC